MRLDAILIGLYVHCYCLILFWKLNAAERGFGNFTPLERKVFADLSPMTIGVNKLSAALGKDISRATTFDILLRIIELNGIAFLIYLGFNSTWYYPIMIFIVAAVTMSLSAVLIQRIFGAQIPAILSMVLLPIVGVWFWFLF